MHLLDVITTTANFAFGASRTVVTGNYSSTSVDVLVSNVNDLDDKRYDVFLLALSMYADPEEFAFPLEVVLKTIDVPGANAHMHFVISGNPEFSSILDVSEIRNLILTLGDEFIDQFTAKTVAAQAGIAFNDAAIVELQSMKAALISSL